ncbi:hypothetical protein [Helicobacter sp. CLO-3]|uniref:hypothetical protein n=1 Tax=Helicobacter sp. CLO-3 TaxID=211 RepID=UPI00155F91A6|nr:hypothetical protein [Helicobacter sp. CLO-3]
MGEAQVKKTMWLCFVSLVCLNGSDIKFDGELAGKADREAYSYEKKVKIIKRIGIEYCIKGNDFYETRTDVQVLGLYTNKLGLGFGAILPPLELKSYIDAKSIISYETIYNHYKNSNFSRFYICLDMYDSKEYHDEVERIVKAKEERKVKQHCKKCE